MKAALFLIILLSSFTSSLAQDFVIKSPSTGEMIKIAKKDLIIKGKLEMSWDEAMKQVEKLGNGWRLPTTDELLTMREELYFKKKGNFSEGGLYWTETKCDAYNSKTVAFRRNFLDVSVACTPMQEGYHNIRPVQGFIPLGSVRLPLIIKSPTTGRDIQVEHDDLIKSMTWIKAQEEVTKLGNGWRLPTIEELEAIQMKIDNSIGFNFAPDYNGSYWSGTEKNATEVFHYSFLHKYNNRQTNSKEYDNAKVRVVRDIEKMSVDNIDLVTIGSQVWMQKNLDVSHFRNGDPILQAKSAKQWEILNKEKVPGWCYYGFGSSNRWHGKLYNFYAVVDKRGIAPTGYHIPSDKEWTTLREFLGNSENAGDKLKSSIGWDGYTGNENGSNSSRFNGLPSGTCNSKGDFLIDNIHTIGKYGYWWSSNEKNSDSAYIRLLNADNSFFPRKIGSKSSGYSIRCIQDVELIKGSDQTSSISTVIIGEQEWTNQNLSVRKFRNGDQIFLAKTPEEWENSLIEKKPAMCFYNFENDNKNSYGAFYNWYAVKDYRGIAPIGFHIPTDLEWSELINYLGGENVAGIKMKSKIGWKKNGNGDDSFGFNAIPAGHLLSPDIFQWINEEGYWWSSTMTNTYYAYVYSLNSYKGNVLRSGKSISSGFSVRCVKD